MSIATNRIILTPELIKKVAEEAPKSPAAQAKLARAIASYEKHKEGLKRFLK
ncbi:MAG: hypothetical protein RLZZ175_970 [Bacteroidota bacterium]|jgi:hypothetical protein